MYQDDVWKEWVANVMAIKPKSNLLDSKRGVEVTKLCISYERQDFDWHRSDIDVFWVDVQINQTVNNIELQRTDVHLLAALNLQRVHRPHPVYIVPYLIAP